MSDLRRAVKTIGAHQPAKELPRQASDARLAMLESSSSYDEAKNFFSDTKRASRVYLNEAATSWLALQ
ncbi:hypothetical protein D3C86_1947930 [compost metagenome]